MFRLLLSALLLTASAGAAWAGAYQDALLNRRLGNHWRAFQDLQSLAGQGHREAAFEVGNMLYRGQGAPQNYQEAGRWYRSAAEQGHPGAQNNLGLLYRDGKGVPHNPVLAYMWFSMAASQGDPSGLQNRDALARRLQPDQVLQAQQLAAEFNQGLAERLQAAATPDTPPNAPAVVAEQTGAAAPQTLHNGFLVQLGLFGNLDNVKRIGSELKSLDVQLVKKRVEHNGQSYYRLRVGPYPTMVEAERVRQWMDEIFNIHSIVVPQQL